MNTTEPLLTDIRLPEEAYNDLYRQVADSGYTNVTYQYFILHALVALLGIGGSLYISSAVTSVAPFILSAILFAFFSVQLGLLGHDLSHQQVFKNRNCNIFWAVVVWGLGCGLSESRWYFKHNSHHQGPNHIGHDPDIDIPFVFSDEQTERYSPCTKKYILPYQHYLFWVGLCFVYPYNILHSMRFIFQNLNIRAIVEIILISIHFVLLLIFSFTTQSVELAIVWNVVVCLIMGLYMGLIFAPNHKGEAMLSEDAPYNWVYQITFTRNIKTSCIGDYVMGGLQFQIEHHLFPQVSRFNYRSIQKIIRTFCQKHNIPYHETGWLSSMYQIHQALKEAAPKS